MIFCKFNIYKKSYLLEILILKKNNIDENFK